MIDNIVGRLDELNIGDGVIHYNIDKELAGPWNLIFGAQYRHHKHWQIRTEVGIWKTYTISSEFKLRFCYSEEKES